LQTRRWEDNEGVKHTSIEIVANEMMILGDRRDSAAPQPVDTSLADEDQIEDEYPF